VIEAYEKGEVPPVLKIRRCRCKRLSTAGARHLIASDVRRAVFLINNVRDSHEPHYPMDPGNRSDGERLGRSRSTVRLRNATSRRVDDEEAPLYDDVAFWKEREANVK
jgi:hypothetical protein